MADEFIDLEAIERRAKGIQEWLEKNGRGCFEEQKHVRAETVEKIYWHYGYMVALMDVLRLLGCQLTTASAPEHTPKPDRYN